MRVGDYCRRGVVTINGDASITDAARTMRDHHVGFLVVLDQEKTQQELTYMDVGNADLVGNIDRPVGVLTDRDIVVQVDARDVGPKTVAVSDVMTRQPVLAHEDDDLHDLMQGMHAAGVRRVPVVDAAGALTGIIAVDDVFEIVAGLMQNVCGTIDSEQRMEHQKRSG
jgi:CBS domain-containing protein